jgi:soluble lytic murein transglycosylase
MTVKASALKNPAIAVCALMALAIGGAAHAAAPPLPSRKPPQPVVSTVVSTQEAAILRDALQAEEDGDWSGVRRALNRARDPVVKDLIRWRLALGEPGTGFDELDGYLRTLGEWPGLASVRARAEDAISLSSLSARERVAWLERSGPRTGEGKAALALALREMGETARANAVAKDAWRNHALNATNLRALQQTFAGQLSADDHRARADFLLWTERYGLAEDMLGLVGSDWEALIRARIALARRARGVDAKVQAVPASLQEHPGLLFERARWRRRAGQETGIDELLLRIDGKAVPASGRERLWEERQVAVRRNIRLGNLDTAYRLAEPHGMETGAIFAEAEFVAGWLALRKTGQAARGLEHFRALEKGVTTPISQARAHYWTGRALEAVRAPAEEARAQFAEAGKYPTTFYGQLGAEEAGGGTITLALSQAITPQARAAFEARHLTRAARLLAEAGRTSLFREVVLFYDSLAITDVEHELLFELSVEYQQPHIGLRGAKAGLARGVVAPDAAYPLLGVQPTRKANVEDALVAALSRQESEFNPKAVSSADARGLMQLLPSTARREAAIAGLPFRASWLTDDPSYNVTLGAQHLAGLVNQFRGSYVLAIAAYNAGASRPKAWMELYGDPRRKDVETVVDWVETIPFGETRNYVMRVLENLQVYRHRMSGEPERVRLSEDLRRGEPGQ